MHILIIPSTHYLTKHYPLSGIFEHHQVAALCRAGHSVGVISLGVVGLRFFLRRYHYNKIDRQGPYPIYRFYQRVFLPRRWLSARYLFELYKKIGLKLYLNYKEIHGKPDIIHVHGMSFETSIALFIKNIDHVPYVITEHSSSFDRKFKEFRKNHFDFIRCSSKIIAVSRYLAKIIEVECNINNVIVIPNVVDNVFFKKKNYIKKTNDVYTFLTIGSLDKNKNHEDLIYAFFKVFKNTNVVLRIAGNGPLRRKIIKLIAKLKLENQIKLLGQLSREDVYNEMIKSNCFILSSKSETFGVVLIEALACGIPVISTSSGGPNEIISGENGLLVILNDVDDLSYAMQKMHTDSSQYNAEFLMNSCKNLYGEQSFINKIEKVYKTILEK